MDSFGTWVDAWSHSKTSLPVQENSIQKIAFACAVHTSYGDDADRAFDVAQKLDCILVHLKHCQNKKLKVRQSDQLRIRSHLNTYNSCWGLL